MADLSVQAVLSAQTSQFQREFNNAGRTAQRFSGGLRHVQQQVNRVNFDRVGQQFGVFKQLQKQFGSGTAKEVFKGLDDFGDLAFFGGLKFAGGVAVLGSFVDLALRGKDATFGFAGAINAVRNAVVGIEPDLAKINKAVNDLITKFRQPLRLKLDALRPEEGLLPDQKSFFNVLMRSQEERFAIARQQQREANFLPPDLQAAANQQRQAASAAFQEAQKALRGLSGIRGALTKIDIDKAIAQADPNLSFEDRKLRVEQTFAEMRRIGERSLEAARAENAQVDVWIKQRVDQLERARSIARGVPAAIGAAFADFGMGQFNQLRSVGNELRFGDQSAEQAVNRFVMNGRSAFDQLSNAVLEFKSKVDSAATAAKEFSKGEIGQFTSEIAALKSAFLGRKISADELGAGAFRARGFLVDAAENLLNRAPVGAVRGSSAALDAIQRIESRDRAERNAEEIMEDNNRILKELAAEIGREMALVLRPPQKAQF